MFKSVITPVAATLIAFSGIAVTTCAYAQQQPAAPAVRQQANAVTESGTTQLAARSNDGNGVRTEAAPKVVVPLRQTPSRTPATQDSDCVGPVSFCNVYFGS
ncbi:hypothetical protein [Burkholderia sp. 22313]|uniref:hypothetical protein n=1 Tax=Burkholderia sp. 22313 TaxID=3453908 RepID=UPI002CCEE9FF|nr:hypothetical protein [Burkholderia sp.]